MTNAELPSYQLRLANEAQSEACLAIEARSLDNAGLSPEAYLNLRREALNTPLAELKRRWVLVPRNDPDSLTGIVSLCKDYRLPLLVKLPGVPEPRRCIAYALATVVTPPECRRKGHAAQLVRQWVDQFKSEGLDAFGFPEATDPDSHLHDGILGVLYSAIGQYYAPFGFKTMSPLTVRWQAGDDEARREEAVKQLPDTAPLQESDFARLSALDEALFTQQLAAQSPEGVVSMAIMDPSGNSIRAKTDVCRLMAPLVNKSESLPSSWGACIIGNGTIDKPEAWALWTIDWFDSCLQVLRIRASDSKQLRALVRAARRVAQETGVKEMDAWNVDEGLLKEVGWRASERTDALPCVAWWGQNKLEEGLRWVNNERGLYC